MQEQKSLCNQIESLGGKKHLLVRQNEKALSRVVDLMILGLTLRPTNVVERVVVVLETERKAREFNELLESHQLGRDFNYYLRKSEPTFNLNLTTTVVVCGAKCFFETAARNDRLTSGLWKTPAKCLLVFLDVALDTLLKVRNNSEQIPIWVQITSMTTVLAVCKPFERKYYEGALQWTFAHIDDVTDQDQASPHAQLFKSALKSGPSDVRLDYSANNLHPVYAETIQVIKRAGSLLASGGIVVICSKRDRVEQLFKEFQDCNARAEMGIDVDKVFSRQRDESMSQITQTLFEYERVPTNQKKILFTNLRTLMNLDDIESVFKSAKLVFFVGLPYTHFNMDNFEIRKYVAANLMNSLIREYLDDQRYGNGSRAILILDKNMREDVRNMLVGGLQDIRIEDFYPMRDRLRNFLAQM